MPHSDQIHASWEQNAAAWTTAVREGLIASRRAGTDAAIVDACRPHATGSVLDVGCGEGWLARALGAAGGSVTGIDASAPLIDTARAAGGARYEVAGYADLVANPHRLSGPWGLIVANFALLDEEQVPLLRALGERLAPTGRLLVQTVHPWVAAGDGAYQDGWRTETFAAFPVPFPAQMPWYFRTLARWLRDIDQAGLRLCRLEEPAHPETGRPLSLLLALKRGEEGAPRSGPQP